MERRNQKTATMTNQIFYWKSITSPADLPKDAYQAFIKTGGNMNIGYYDPETKKWYCWQYGEAVEIENTADLEYLCPLKVDNIPEWVSEKAKEYQLENDGLVERFDTLIPGQIRSILRNSFTEGAKLLLPLINQGKGETESKGESSVSSVGNSVRLPENVKITILEFQKEHPSAMLTGTCALVLYGFDLERPISDIDFILPEPPNPIPSSWSETQMPDGFQAKAYWHPRNGLKVETIIWDEYVAMIVDGIRVTSIYEIIEEKKNLGLTGTKKHLLDFHKMLLQTIPLSLSQLTAPVNYSKFAILNKKEIT